MQILSFSISLYNTSIPGAGSLLAPFRGLEHSVEDYAAVQTIKYLSSVPFLIFLYKIIFIEVRPLRQGRY